MNCLRLGIYEAVTIVRSVLTLPFAFGILSLKHTYICMTTNYCISLGFPQ